MQIIHFFENISSLQRMLILISGLVFFMGIEFWIPLMKGKYKYTSHATANLFFTLTTVVINVLFAALIVLASDIMIKNNWGILYYFTDAPVWIYVFIGLLILDLIAAYIVHRVEHQVFWMWKLHLVHHSDTHIDATSANRHHPGESVIRAMFTLLAVIIAGAPMWLVMLYQSGSVLLSQMNHANISLPGWLDKLIRVVFVSPNMHKVHHHYQRPLTDKNYGNMFSIWDRIFGSYARVQNPQTDLVYGIDHKKENGSNNIKVLFRMPWASHTENNLADK